MSNMNGYQFGTVIQIIDNNQEAYDIMYKAAIKSWGVFVEPILETSKNSQKARAYGRKKQPKQVRPTTSPATK